jgi:hypothetical protein
MDEKQKGSSENGKVAIEKATEFAKKKMEKLKKHKAKRGQKK